METTGSGRPPDDEYRCAFCSKVRAEVRNMIRHEGGLCICDQCIETCNQILKKERELPAKPERPPGGGGT